VTVRFTVAGATSFRGDLVKVSNTGVTSDCLYIMYFTNS